MGHIADSLTTGTRALKIAEVPCYITFVPETPPMKIICTRQNKDGSYDEVGMNNRFLTSNYTTTNGFLRYGIPTHFYGHTLQLEVFYGDNVYRNPDKTVYVTV